MTIITCRSLLTTLSLVACAAHADEAALYDQAAPDDALFVRVLSKTDPSLATVEFGGAALPLAEFKAGSYVAISAADLKGAEPGGYYSLAVAKAGHQTIQEPHRETAAKVHLILVNTGATAVRLVVPGQGMEVVAPVNAGQSASRAVNPVSTELAVERVSDGAILGTFDVRLSRGQNLSFVAGEDTARLVKNSFGPVLTLN